MKKGKIIVIEGTDCSGKNTQTDLLIQKLKHEAILCEKMNFPDYSTPTGKIVGGPYLGKPEICESFFEDPAHFNPKIASLYYAADRLNAKEKIEKLLQNGYVVVLDRYVESNAGHQGGKIKDPVERKQFFDFLFKLEYDLLELPKPDLVVFLYMPYQIGMELKKRRAGEADAHEKDDLHLKNAEDCYLQLQSLYGWEKINCTENGVKTREKIANEVWSIINDKLGVNHGNH